MIASISKEFRDDEEPISRWSGITISWEMWEMLCSDQHAQAFRAPGKLTLQSTLSVPSLCQTRDNKDSGVRSSRVEVQCCK